MHNTLTKNNFAKQNRSSNKAKPVVDLFCISNR